MSSAGEFGRVKRRGDEMKGDLKFVDGVAIIDFLDAAGGVRRAAIRVNGNDLEFYDTTTGVWSPLSTLRVLLAAVAPPADGAAGAAGVSGNAARQDHQHPADDWDNLVTKVQGDVPFFTAAGAPSRLAAGIIGEVLTSGGPGADVVWGIGGGTPGHSLYEEQAITGAGPNHTINLVAGSYPVGGGALLVEIGGLAWPQSAITEVTPTQFIIVGYGPMVAVSVVARVPLGSPVAGMITNLYEPQAAGAGQTIFNLLTGTYGPGTQSLHVFVNGVLVPNNGVYYTETGPAIVTFLGVPPFVMIGGEGVLFVVFQGASTPVYTPANGADWVNPDPVNVQDALDRIAAALVVHTGVAIP